MKGADAVLKALEQEGVEVIFGIPGGASMPIYDPLVDRSPIRHVLCRHEQGAGHAAEGYAWATGKVGVCMATSGPGATNLVTPLADAKMDSVPIVAITGQVPTPVVGNDAFQEADITGITMPITKHNFLVKDPAEIVETVREAFHIAATGRPGPVVIDLPKDVLNADVDYVWPERVKLPGYKPTTKGNNRQIVEAVKLILAAERPVLYVGGGVVKADATAELAQLATTGRLPVVTTLMARGAFPDSHELCLGMPGMHGNYTAVTSMQRADLLVALGARFDDRVTGKLAAFAPHAKIVHVDIDPAEIGKNRVADVPIVGDCRDVIGKMAAELARRQEEGGAPDRSAWLAQLDEWRTRYPYRYQQEQDGPIKPQYAVERLRHFADDDTILVAGVGQHQMYASQWWRFERPRHWINSGGLGTMGFAVPAAMGAKVGRPDARVVAIDGDGCFQMTAQELATSSTEDIPFITAILNNGYLGMVRQWQELFFE
ncbi:MAG TPA: biosynthetic-type acetolactate synthase large subunit, partial [Actinomycetota bacterium]|nr:biosynthetic-type acetolactate synthase large subunit [Actinomycetota bacterium]